MADAVVAAHTTALLLPVDVQGIRTALREVGRVRDDMRPRRLEQRNEVYLELIKVYSQCHHGF